jgi:hypothetical protein
MRNVDARRSAGIAGAVLLAMPVLDVATGGGPAGPVHAVIGVLALALIALSAPPGAGDSKSTHFFSRR